MAELQRVLTLELLFRVVDVYIYDDAAQLDEVPAAGTPPAALGSVPAWKRLLWEGGHPSDAFLTAASAQVGFGALRLLGFVHAHAMIPWEDHVQSLLPTCSVIIDQSPSRV